MNGYALLAFESTHSAIAALKALESLNAVLMPTLREITASCGMSLRLEPGLAGEAAKKLAALGIAYRLYDVRHTPEGLECTPLEG